MGFANTAIEKLGNAANFINNLKYIIVIKNAFTALIPVIITGAFAALFSNMVFDSTNGLAQVEFLSFLSHLKPIAVSINYATMNILTIGAIFLIGLELGRINNIKSFFVGFLALICYVAVNPTTTNIIFNDEAIPVANVLARDYTDTRGLFLGMFIAIFSIELFTYLGKQKKLQIKMPDSVPTNVATSFSNLIPTILTVVIIATGGFIIHSVSGMYLYDIIYVTVQRPLEGVMQGLPGILILMLVSQVFWVIGIHGNQMIKPIREPLLLASIAMNTDAYMAGEEIPNIITMPFWDMYMNMGGSGATIGLLISIFLIGKRDDMKEISKLSIGPGIFNINEPVIFGMPIMLNPILAIPFIITPLITGTIGYIATVTEFAGKAVVMVPWSTPPIISAYLATGGNIGAVITQIVCIVVSILIYLPFVKLSNSRMPGQ